MGNGKKGKVETEQGKGESEMENGKKGKGEMEQGKGEREMGNGKKETGKSGHGSRNLRGVRRFGAFVIRSETPSRTVSRA
jgi:hypothetical protein